MMWRTAGLVNGGGHGAASLTAAILLLCGGCAVHAKGGTSVPAAAPVLLAVPDVQQSTDFSCGASALQSILAYYGVPIYEDELIEKLGSNEEVGTTSESILRVARALGFRAEIAENLTLDDLHAALEERVPVLIGFQAWIDVKPQGFSWAETWDEGHWAVVIGMDAEFVYLEDPSLFGTRGRVHLQEFLERWHDEGYSWPAVPDDSGRRWHHPGIFIRKADTPGWEPPPFTDVE